MYHLAHGLKGLGHDVEIVSLVGKADFRKNSPALDGGIVVHRAEPIKIKDDRGLLNFCLPTSRPMLEELCALWKKFLEVHKEKPFDIAEAPEHFAEGVFVAASKAVPLVIRLHTPHSKLLNERFHNFTPSFDHQFLSTAERIAMLQADQLVSPSEDLAGYVANDLNYPLAKIAIIRNPVDAEQFCPEGARALSSDGKLTVLFVGRLEERKGIHHLVDAIPKVLSQFQNVKFVIIGSDTMTAKGNGSVLAELRQALSSSSRSDSVTFIPHVPLSEIVDYYRSADILVLPSLYDNAPMTVIEAMSCGKPVIGTTAGGTKEYVIHDNCGLIVPPANADELAKALVSLLADDARRASMGQNARDRVMKYFTRETMTQSTVDLYTATIKRWATNEHSALYRKASEELLPDLMTMLNSCENTLYNLVFLHSMSFRFEHWAQKAKRDPSKILAKIFGG
jgi:glycosyltransferase involved in cell wall biosynthesis